MEKEEDDDAIPYNRYSANIENLKNMHESLNLIEEAYEQSSQYLSESDKNSSNILSGSIQKS